MATADLYYLLSDILSTADWPHPSYPDRRLWDDPWILDRCREVQFASEGVLMIWSRGMGKTTICSFGENIRRALEDPNRTIAIFSMTKGLADGRLNQIKTEFETNKRLQQLFPDRLWEKPKYEAPSWSAGNGLTLKRERNLINATIEAHGLIGGSYTGSRFSDRCYDDIVDDSVVTTPEQIDKCYTQFLLSQACGMPTTSDRIIGTFYARNDPHTKLIRDGWPYSIHPCYEVDWEKSEFRMDDDTGNVVPMKLAHDFDRPVFYSQDSIDGRGNKKSWKNRLRAQFSIQMLLDPMANVDRAFDTAWLRYYKESPLTAMQGKNIYILVDPANEKKKHSSYTSMWVVGLGPDRNYYVLDAVRKRMDLAERTDALFDLVQFWRPEEVIYEQYGFHADVPHMEIEMEHRSYRFDILPVKGFSKKDDRIGRLIPVFKDGRIYFPKEGIIQLEDDGTETNLVQTFINEEYIAWPQTDWKDMLDALSRLMEPEVNYIWPKPKNYRRNVDAYAEALKQSMRGPQTSWMAV